MQIGVTYHNSKSASITVSGFWGNEIFKLMTAQFELTDRYVPAIEFIVIASILPSLNDSVEGG